MQQRCSSGATAVQQSAARPAKSLPGHLPVICRVLARLHARFYAVVCVGIVAVYVIFGLGDVVIEVAYPVGLRS